VEQEHNKQKMMESRGAVKARAAGEISFLGG
jgi:hypothetical protein